MSIAFDHAKDAANIAKHGVSLARAADLDVFARIMDARFEEPRYKAFGLLDGQAIAWPTRSVTAEFAPSVFGARI